MQVMDEDARRVSEVSGLKLQMAGHVDAPVVLGGFPKSGLDKWVGKLARAGYSTAIAFQTPAKERHVAEVIRVTPSARRGEPRDASVEGARHDGAVCAPAHLPRGVRSGVRPP